MDEGSGPGREEKLSQLLSEASKAHSIYEKDVLHGVRDEAWPTWYAGYLTAHGILDLLAWDSQGREHKEGLALLLADADRLHRDAEVQQHWPDFYARYLLDLGPTGRVSATETEDK